VKLRALTDVGSYLLSPSGDRRISPRWLFRRVSKVHDAYCAAARVEVADDGEFDRVTVNGRAFAWPRTAPRSELLRIACELELPSHVHQYLWGPTQVRQGDVVIDVGACEGGFSAEVAERGAVPIVIEPSRLMQRVVRRLFEIRKLPPPVIVADALAAREGTAFFVDDESNIQVSHLEASGGGSGGGKPGYDVRVTTLDELVPRLGLQRVDFIKCDAEGADVDILRGAEQTLKRFRPKLAFCAYHEKGHFDQMRQFLKPLGYHVKGKGLLQTAHGFVIVMLHAW
jgi:FkbM family methyltransferase